MPKFTRNGVTINFENEPSDEDLDEAFGGEGSTSQDSFGDRFLEQSQLGQAVADPLGTVENLGQAAMQAGGDPIKMIAQGLVGQAMAGKERFGQAFNRIDEGGDTFGRSLRAGQALISPFPIIGEMVQPLDEDIQGRNPLGVGGTLAGVGLDAAASALVPKIPGVISATKSGYNRTGSAIAENASRRMAANQNLGPVTFREAARDLYTKRLPLVAATSLMGQPGLGLGIAGGLEAGKMVSRSQTLARMQQSIGRKMAPVNSELAEFLAKEDGNPALKSAILDEVEEVPTSFRQDIPEYHELAPDPPNQIKTPEELWQNEFVDEFTQPSVQGGQEPWDATKGSQTRPNVSTERTTLPEIRGKEGKRLYGEDQNRVSRPQKKEAGEDDINLDPEDNIDIDLDEPEIVSQRGKLVDTSVKESPKKVEVVDKTIPFSDLEAGNRVKTANGKEGTLEAFDEKSVVVKWDNGTRNRIARKAVEKVEESAERQSGSLRAPKNPKMASIQIPEGTTIKRNADFKDSGGYDITVAGETHQVYRDPESGWWYLDKSSDLAKGEHFSGRGIGFTKQEALDNVVNKVSKRNEAKKASPKGESIDEPIGDVDPFGQEPVRKASGARTKIEPQYPPAQERLPTYKVSGEPTPRSDLTNTRMTGENPRALGLNDRAISASKAGWKLDDKVIAEFLSKGTKHIQINIDDVFEAAKKDINRPGRVQESKLTRAKNFLSGKSKEGTFTPEISIKNGKLIIDDGYHRMEAAKSFGEKSVPVRIPLEQLNLLRELKIPFRDLTPK